MTAPAVRPPAFGCPRCTFTAPTSRSDPDAHVNALHDHIVAAHAWWSTGAVYTLLAQIRPLTAEEVSS